LIEFVEGQEALYDAFIAEHEETVGFRAAHAMWFEQTFGVHWIAAVAWQADRTPYPLVFSQLSW
jgi:hypothetical protein